MQMRKRETSPCRVPCRLGRMGPADVVVDGVVVEAGGGVGGAEVVVEKPELRLGDMSQTCGWPEGPKNCGDKIDRASAESMGRRRPHETLQSGRPERGDPGGRDRSRCNCGTTVNGDRSLSNERRQSLG
jgi:hypothetical protein